MRKHADWLTQTDERVLEFLSEEGNHQPSAIRDRLDESAVQMDYSSGHIGRECRKMAEYGLVVNVGGGTYSITSRGKEFLEGGLDAGMLEGGD